MKLIEVANKIDSLRVAQAECEKNLAKYCAHRNVETPEFGDRSKQQITEWLQEHQARGYEIMHLISSRQYTNLVTNVTIEIDGKQITRTIAEWILRRGGKDKRGMAYTEKGAWSALGDKGITEGTTTDSQGRSVEIKIVRNFDPVRKVKMIAVLTDEPHKIDGALQVANAATELVELPRGGVESVK